MARIDVLSRKKFGNIESEMGSKKTSQPASQPANGCAYETTGF
jgi:hypothetical protein